MDEEFREFLDIFKEESLERLVNVTRSFDALSAGEGEATNHLDEVDRELHTIKGSSRLLGFGELGTFVHTVESLARAYRERPALGLDLLIEACDRLSAMVETAAASGEDLTDAPLRARVEAAVKGDASPSPAPKAEPRVETVQPKTEQPEPGTAKLDVESSSRRRSTRSEDETVRVRASRLAKLDEIVSDFSLAQQRLERYEVRLRDLTRGVDEGSVGAQLASQVLSRMVQDYRGDLLQIHTSTAALERLAVDVRLRPVSFLFDYVPREARELARRLGKQVRVRIVGEETEMDRVILEALKSPLTHLLRNALDHGLEKPQARVAAGKPPEGLLLVSAGQEGSQVAIRVEDDGRGINPGQIRRLAVERGLIDAKSAKELSDDEAIQFIFVPGFSTKTSTSEISGRGVGMHAVQRAVEQLKGEVRVRARPEGGTEVIVRLPLTLLISRVTLMRSGGQQFAVPTESVEESIRLPLTKVATFGDRPSILVGDETVPFLRLASLFGHPVLPDPKHLRVLVVTHAGDRLAIAVDELLDESSVVVKPLGWPLDLLPLVSGAILMPDGEIALQVHVPEIFKQVRGGRVTVADPERHTGERTILVVDDSIVSRQLIARAVRSLGFEPLTAVDGVEAWSLLERVRPQMIVTDVEMPRLDGLGLVRRVRRDERLGGIPIIIFSNRGAEQDRRAGLEAGADAYLAKDEFSHEAFRNVIERML